MTLLRSLILMTCVFAVHPAAAIYQCVEASGKLTFQDRPCPVGQQQSLVGTEQTANAESDEAPVIWSIASGERVVSLGLPRHWQGEKRPSVAATVLHASSEGAARQHLLLTVMPRKARTTSMEQALADLLRAVRFENKNDAGQALFKELPFSTVLMTQAASGAYLITGNAPATRLAGDMRQFDYAIVGAIVTDATMIHFRLLTDDPQSDDARMVLASLQMLVEK